MINPFHVIAGTMPMIDQFDDDEEKGPSDPLTPLNIKKKNKKPVAVALEDANPGSDLPVITAAGRGKIAEQILQLAFENNIKVREDSDLAEILATIEIDSPIPGEAFMAVAEILSYVYRANGQPNPFDSVINDDNDT
jgi:flagellar biosynthesis protein